VTNDYNGFTGRQRDRKLRALHRLHAEGIYPGTGRPCDLCNDPDAATAPHSEDYSEPYQWEPPAVYAVCGSCHRWLHQRFRRPVDWEAFKHHVARGGYALEFAKGPVLKERKAARAEGESYQWKPIPGRNTVQLNATVWWEKLK